MSVGEEFSTYDVEKANALLDEMGLTERDADGMRMVDGQPFSILLEHGAHAPDLGPVAELVSEQFKEVGIDLQVKQIDPQLWDQRTLANELQATMFWAHDQGWDSDYSGSDSFRRTGRLWAPVARDQRRRRRGAAAVGQGHVRPGRRPLELASPVRTSSTSSRKIPSPGRAPICR